MKEHIITDEEAKTALQTYFREPGGLGAMKVVLTDFLTNRPESTLGKLRPIAEMPETVPEGCVKVYVVCYGKTWLVEKEYGFDPTHFAFIQLPAPDPEAEERQRFEELFNVGQKLYLWGPKAPVWTGSRYELDLHENVWLGWKLAKAK